MQIYLNDAKKGCMKLKKLFQKIFFNETARRRIILIFHIPPGDPIDYDFTKNYFINKISG